MANYYNINRSVEAYEFRTIDPNNGQLRNILDIAGSGGGGGGSVDLTNYYTKAETNNSPLIMIVVKLMVYSQVITQKLRRMIYLPLTIQKLKPMVYSPLTIQKLKPMVYSPLTIQKLKPITPYYTN